MKYRHIRWKYKVAEGFAYKLKCKYRFTAPLPFSNEYFGITADGEWLLIFNTYAWDGATKFPDFKWIKTQSAIHDALHEAIRLGIISVEDNDTIDLELDKSIAGGKATRWSKKKVLQLRGWYVRKATNLVDEKVADEEPPLEIPPIDGEISLAEFYRRSGI